MKTADEIFQEMKNLFAEKTGYEISDECDMAVRMYAAASQTEALYIYGQWVMRQYFPQTAEGEYLDRHGELRGLLRESAVCAEGEMSFTVSTAAKSDIDIPAGTVCVNAAGAEFVTLTDGKIAAGSKSCTVAARAINAGKAGNAAAKTVIFMTNAPVGVESCINQSAFWGGRDAEEDDAYRARILESYKTLPNGANAAWYKKTALEIPGVASAGVSCCPRGAGSVDVYIASKSGLPDENLLAAVQAVFDEKREICSDVQVLSPMEASLSIEAEVKVLPGYNADQVCAAVTDALSGIFDSRILGRKLYMTELCDCIHHVPGVESYRLINPDFDYISQPNVIMKAGEITVSRWN